MAQSGVGPHILDLEGEIGIELFVCKGKRLAVLIKPGKGSSAASHAR